MPRRRTSSDRRAAARCRRSSNDPANRYIAVIGGDIHNYQRYPMRHECRAATIQHIVSGAAGAYTKATHKIPKIKFEQAGCTEDDFRCYPRRGDSLAAYSRLYDRPLLLQEGSTWSSPTTQAPGDHDPADWRARSTRRGSADRDSEEITPEGLAGGEAWHHQARAGCCRALPPGTSPRSLDWNDPPPPLFKSFLRDRR